MSNKTYPYLIKTSAVKRFLEIAQTSGVPDKVTTTFIYSVGLRSVNDRPVPRVLKFIGFLSEDGTPTELYRHYRNKSLAPQVMARAVQQAYAELFKVYPDAHKRDHQTLRNFFSTHTNVGERAVQGIVETFKTLCSLAKFGEGDDIIEEVPDEKEPYARKVNLKDASRIDIALGDGRSAVITIPSDIKPDEVDRLKALLDALAK